MSQYQPKPGTFSLFVNGKKSSDKAPDYRGDGVLLDGTRVEVAGWKRTANSGTVYLSCTIGPPRPREGQPQQAQQTLPMDDAPF